MNKQKENVILLRAVTSSGDFIKSSFYISSFFYDALQRKQVMKLVAENYGKSWKGAALYIGTSNFGFGAIWRFGTLSKYLFTQDDFKDVKTCTYQEEFFNGFC